MRYDPIKKKSKPKIIKIYKMYKNKNVYLISAQNEKYQKKILNYTSTDKRKLTHGEGSQ